MTLRNYPYDHPYGEYADGLNRKPSFFRGVAVALTITFGTTFIGFMGWQALTADDLRHQENFRSYASVGAR